MATEALKAKRRMDAETRIESLVSALAEKSSVKIESTNYPVRDLELKRVVSIEHLADALEQILAGFESKEAKLVTRKSK